MSRPAVELDCWPSDLAPVDSTVFVHNHRLLAATPNDIWSWLIDAERWPQWYGNARNVRVLGSQHQLHADAEFAWETLGTRLRSEVMVFEPPTKLGWYWSCRGAYGFHGWQLSDHPGGTRVVTEETQRGPKIAALRFVLRPAMLAAHSGWLRQLDRVVRDRRPQGRA